MQGKLEAALHKNELVGMMRDKIKAEQPYLDYTSELTNFMY